MHLFYIQKKRQTLDPWIQVIETKVDPIHWKSRSNSYETQTVQKGDQVETREATIHETWIVLLTSSFFQNLITSQ